MPDSSPEPVPIRWGILGTGMIAEKFARDLPRSRSGTLAAVASRSVEKAEAFLGAVGDSASAFGSYEELVSDPSVDAVYIALPNAFHREWTLAALASGKHVLCEKPLALDADEATEMFAAAAAANRLLMEATMYRALPQTRLLLDTIRSGRIGEPRLLRANFTFSRPADPSDARYRPGPGGGSLMDVGIYCIDFARSIAGAEPLRASAVLHRHDSGVDDYAAGVLAFPEGLLATFTCGMTVVSDQTAHLAGTEARIEIPRFWFGAEGFEIIAPDGTRESIAAAAEPLPIYAIEADAFAGVLAGGENWNPASNTIGNLLAIAHLRRS